MLPHARIASLAVGLASIPAIDALATPLTARADAARRAALELRATTVEVNSGQTLTEADLLAGVFSGQSFTLDADTTFEINDGGAIGPLGDAETNPHHPFNFGGATININSGGRIDDQAPDRLPTLVANCRLHLFAGAEADWTLGAFGGAEVNVLGGNARGAFAAAGGVVNLSSGVLVSAAVGDGGRMNMSGGQVSLLAQIDPGGALLITGGQIAAQALRVTGGALHVLGGEVGPQARVDAGSIVNIADGVVGEQFLAVGGEINVSGGRVGDDFKALNLAVVNISGGEIGDGFIAGNKAVNITGGTIGADYFAASGNITTIRGGDIGDSFMAASGSLVRLFVTAITIDGVALELDRLETIEITARGGALLEATLLDGAALDFRLNDTGVLGEDFFSSGATLTVTLVPTPGAAPLLALAGLLATRRQR